MRIRNSRRRWGGWGRCGIFVLFGLWSQVTLSADSGMLGRGDSGCFSCWLEVGTCDADVSDTNRRDAEGRRQGLWIGMGEGGGMRYRGCFKDDMPEGWFAYTRGDTLVAEAFYFRGGYASFNRFFYPDSMLMAEGYYLDKQKDSIWAFYDREGRLLRREAYQSGLKNGVLEIFDTLGNVLVHQEWFRGLRNGHWMEWDDYGYRDYHYKLNLAHGSYLAFYPDSIQSVSGQYEEGRKQGAWRFYSQDGILCREDSYRDNVLEKRVLYLKFQQEPMPVAMDTIALVMLSPQGGRAELLTDFGKRLLCDEPYGRVCEMLDMEMDFYFYANPNVLVAYRVVDPDRMPAFLDQMGGREDEAYDGQSDPMRQLGQGASVFPVQMPLTVQTPFPVYLDANGMELVRSVFSEMGVGVQFEER